MRQSRIARMPWLFQASLLRKTPIGYINGQPVYPICGSDGEGDGTGDGDGDKGASGSGSGSDDDDDDDDGDDAADANAKPPKDPKQYQAWLKNKQLQDENAKRRVAAKKAREERDAALAELEQIKQKDMSELQKAQNSAAKAEKERDELASRVEGMQVELAFLKLPRDKHDWHDPGAALTLLMAEHRDSLTLEDDGTVTGLDQAVKDLAKKHKYLLKPPNTDGNGSGSTGGSVGNGTGDKGGDKGKEAISRFRF